MNKFDQIFDLYLILVPFFYGDKKQVNIEFELDRENSGLSSANILRIWSPILD